MRSTQRVARLTIKGFGIVLVAALLVTGCSSHIPASPSGSTTAPPSPSAAASIAPTGGSGPSLAQLIGQKLVVRMDGLTPSTDLLGRIRRGEVGGVILFGSNVSTPTKLIALTAQLQGAAAAGGQPELLIAVDQEGGPVRRIPWAPPSISPPEMGRIGRLSVARDQGASTGDALRGLGVNVDFAPVADVPASTASFLYRDGRTFSFLATSTASLADAFASGLESKGVLATMKHFPGIGLATQNTDTNPVTITASRAALAPGLLAYRTAILDRIPLIMLSNATYAAYDATNAAGWSHAIAVTLLRDDLGFGGVTITDSLEGTAHARGLSTGSLAIRAARAGTDMILVTGSEASTRGVYATLLGHATDGTISTADLRVSYDRILALKAGLGSLRGN
jgi:beta-N-acetylhexosaminidase